MGQSKMISSNIEMNGVNLTELAERIDLVQYAFYKGSTVKASYELEHSSTDYRCRNRYCPAPRMYLRKGPKRTPHFAHYVETLCDQYSEPDTAAHNAMKAYLQELLNIPDQYMEYGKIRHVRPDLFWKKKFAIEVQHSPIQPEELLRRNTIYLAKGIVPLWIFHAQEPEGNNFYERGTYLQDYEIRGEVKVCDDPRKKCHRYKDYPVFCPQTSCALYEFGPLIDLRDVTIVCPDCQSLNNFREISSTITCSSCGHPINLPPADESYWQRVLGILKLKTAEAYLLPFRERLCYIDFYKNHTPHTALYIIPLTKVMNRETLFYKTLAKKVAPITSEEQFQDWATETLEYFEERGLLQQQKMRVVQKKLGKDALCY